jgi:hypothetical protein
MGLIAAALVLGAAACSDTSAPMEDLVGTWNATAMVFTRVADTTEKVDVIALGATFRMTLAADSTWTAIQTVPLAVPDTATGTWTASLDVLTLEETGQSGNMQFQYVMSGNTVTLTGGSVDFDFGFGDEPATLSITATKQ